MFEGIGNNGQIYVHNGTKGRYRDFEEVITNSSTGAYSVQSTDTTKTIVHTAGGTATYNLPSAVAGLRYRFVHKGTIPSTTAENRANIAPASGDEIWLGNQLAENDGYVSLMKPGTSVDVICLDTGVWQIFSFSGPLQGKNDNRWNDNQDWIQVVGKDAWVQRGDTSQNNNNVQGFTLNSYAFIAGGRSDASLFSDVSERYDDTAKTWSVVDNLVDGARAASCWSQNGFGYKNGGIVASTSTTSANGEKYNISTNLWASIAAMPNVKSFHATCSLNGFGYAVGGSGSDANELLRTYRYNDNANSWSSSVASLNGVGRSSGFGIDTAGFFYVMGGVNNDSSTFFDTLEQFNDSLVAWLYRASFTTARTAVHPIGNLQNKLLMAGGQNSGGTVLATSFEYSPTMNAWTSKTSMTNATVAGAYLSLNGYGLVVQGFTTARTNDTFEYN